MAARAVSQETLAEMVEAAGVELITMLTARKLLIPGSATRAKKDQEVVEKMAAVYKLRDWVSR